MDRKQRFEKITKDLKVTRMFSTLVEEMKAIRGVPNGEQGVTEVMVPVAHSERSPVLLLMGGGMGAGKSTVLKDILKEYIYLSFFVSLFSFLTKRIKYNVFHRPFWLGAAANAVVVEADAFKETDVIYRALSSRGHHQDMLQTAELVNSDFYIMPKYQRSLFFQQKFLVVFVMKQVHQSSTDAASSLLVTALNEGRDVIMDGTLSWEPFVQQTIAMARNVHKHRYRMGIGYKVEDDGTITENYWEQVEEDENGVDFNIRKPYRIELVGVVCDPYLAVVRGIR